MSCDPKEAVELKRGGIYAFRVNARVTQPVLERIRRELEPYEQTHGVKFLVFDESIDLVEAAELQAAVETVVQEKISAMLLRTISQQRVK